MISIKKSYTKIFITAAHIFAWLLLFFVPFFFGHLYSGKGNADPFRISFFIHNLLLVVFFYVNAYLLIPIVYRQKGVFIYTLYVIMCVSLIIVTNTFTSNYFSQHHHSSRSHFSMMFFPCIFILAVSTSYRILIDNATQEREKNENENEQLKSELSFLRSQISPHFMFNILNSIVSLARKKSDQLEPIIVKLSQLIRYMLYESDDLKINLDKEVEYLKNYIELQKLRFGNDIKINFSFDNTEGNNPIEPMLLIPFVENAFKHGVTLVENPEIDISLSVAGEHLIFVVKNKFNPAALEEKDKSSGIGLANVMRRLDLLYRHEHELKIIELSGWYMVRLNLKLK